MSTTIKDHTRVDKSGALVGRTVGKYEILEVVGKGGMGCVYAALNTAINKRVAMKCIDHELAANKEANARFQREALAASSVESPHIVQIFDAGVTEDGVPFIVMELLRGEDLGRHISAVGKLELGEALNIGAQILKGLHHAHGAGIVHRDLKPDNVFLVRRDDDPVLAKLLDFGVSKIARASSDVPLQTLTRQGTVVGTPFYMSPEQAQAFPDVDGRTDIYSTGAILYECLAGRPPHVGRAYEQVIVNICMKDAQDVRTHNPDIPDGVAEVIHKALSRERDDRFPSAEAMLRALKDNAPMSIDIATSSPRLASVSSSGSSRAVTPRIVSTPREGKPANELADTVRFTPAPEEEGAPPEVTQSGISQKTIAAETVRSLSGERRRRWPLALAPGVALLIALALWFRTAGNKGSEDVPSVAAAADDPIPQDMPTSTLPATTTESALPVASATPPGASVERLATTKPPPTSNHAKAKPPNASSTSRPAVEPKPKAPTDAPKPPQPRPELELQVK